MMRKAFTLIELMLVVAIMGLMGTLSVGGYRAMRRGMEERGVVDNASQFVRNAYQRAMIDRQPTAIYFWNELRSEESEDGSESLVAVGRAVAVRRAGRFSSVDVGLIDEFGDLRHLSGKNDENEEDDEEAKEGSKTYIYKVNGNENGFKRYAVSQATFVTDVQSVNPMMTDPGWDLSGDDGKVIAYGFYPAEGAGDWKVGDAYGLEFADITLANNYVFGTPSPSQFKKSNPVVPVNTVIRFSPTDSNVGGQKITISAFRPGKSGALEKHEVGETKSVDSSVAEQTE